MRGGRREQSCEHITSDQEVCGTIGLCLGVPEDRLGNDFGPPNHRIPGALRRPGFSDLPRLAGDADDRDTGLEVVDDGGLELVALREYELQEVSARVVAILEVVPG